LGLTHLRMQIKTAKRLFGTSGTIRSRKQWAIAISRGKMPFKDYTRIPNYNPDRIRLTLEQRILNSILAKVARVQVV
jgi:hypothetical protein